MNSKNKKIFIISLILLTIVSVLFIIFTFFRNTNSGQQTTDGSQKSLFFGSLRPKQKAEKQGSVTNKDSSSVDLGSQNTETQTETGSGQVGSGEIPSGNLGSGSGYFTSLPNPSGIGSGGGLGSGGSGGGLGENEVILPGGGSGSGTGSGGANKKTSICDDPNTPFDIKIQACPNIILANIEPVKFVLTEEEQAELDRLNRSFARLAVYLKTSGDLEDLQSNQDAYQKTASDYAKLAKEMDLEVNSSSYSGPRQRGRSFIGILADKDLKKLLSTIGISERLGKAVDQLFEDEDALGIE